MAKQPATTSNKPIDLTYGFPGALPRAGTSGDTAKLLEFFQLYAQGVSVADATRKVGFSTKWARQYSYRWLKKYADYVTWLQAHVAQVNAQQLALEQSDVLRQIGLIAMANDYDYLVFEREGGKVSVRFKELHELTREQMTAIEVVRGPNGKPKGWKWRDRDGKLFELGKHLGMFNEKVILEHRHRHLHVTADLSKVPLKALEALETEFDRLLAHEEPANAQGRLPAVRGDKGQNGGGGQAAGGGQDVGGQNHQQPGRSRAAKPSTR